MSVSNVSLNMSSEILQLKCWRGSWLAAEQVRQRKRRLFTARISLFTVHCIQRYDQPCLPGLYWEPHQPSPIPLLSGIPRLALKVERVVPSLWTSDDILKVNSGEALASDDQVFWWNGFIQLWEQKHFVSIIMNGRFKINNINHLLNDTFYTD